MSIHWNPIIKKHVVRSGGRDIVELIRSSIPNSAGVTDRDIEIGREAILNLKLNPIGKEVIFTVIDKINRDYVITIGDIGFRFIDIRNL
jgi:hypothetical protein